MPAERAELMGWLEAAPEAVVRVKGIVESAEGRLIGQRVGARCEVSRARSGSPGSLPDHEPAMTVIATPGVDRAELEAWAGALSDP